ncbi:helix-turn-helix domain-containing protein [Chromobacterium violaceum]
MSKNQLNQSPREIRRASGLNQEQFWSRIGVTQSGGSRYENERSMPKPVRTLLNVVHVHQIDLDKITPENAAAVRALLAGEPVVSDLMERQLAANQLEQRARDFDRDINQLLGRIRGASIGIEESAQ